MHGSRIYAYVAGGRAKWKELPVHPNLTVALAEDRRSSCPCGAAIGQLYGPMPPVSRPHGVAALCQSATSARSAPLC